MSLAAASAPPRWKSAGLWIVRGLLALAFAGAGGAKLYGVPMLVESFQHIGLGQWFRYLTGVLEVLGAFLILTPSLAAVGAVLLICIMIGATVTHLFVVGGSAVPALVLLALSAIVAYAKRDQIASLARHL
ncbi:DoxX family protein [Bradyrhizobium sp. AUGA SZCCT0240]|uniref:DoxX family protein n=1 Tax=unclassified Bradyrhizobium TaxID=2631580 RepID=UPI001BAB7219|nr:MULTISPECIES: DoxX family protein [unclassified Bradyrhizobium]MBR1195092.1 DoxX family protein [Bradyrhizobium sp. AUGA SZCCT0158]MBR1243770.1 DoxX family protein [Bradyrhizobium sp. AUGA SZCCT0274]MBR1253003.1 DoxX family protein [Bradyrhizobium sp. AUGA SZCCT0240]